jgi:hypothetical protein
VNNEETVRIQIPVTLACSGALIAVDGSWPGWQPARQLKVEGKGRLTIGLQVDNVDNLPHKILTLRDFEVF